MITFRLSFSDMNKKLCRNFIWDSKPWMSCLEKKLSKKKKTPLFRTTNEYRQYVVTRTLRTQCILCMKNNATEQVFSIGSFFLRQQSWKVDSQEDKVSVNHLSEELTLPLSFLLTLPYRFSHSGILKFHALIDYHCSVRVLSECAITLGKSWPSWVAIQASCEMCDPNSPLFEIG